MVCNWAGAHFDFDALLLSYRPGLGININLCERIFHVMCIARHSRDTMMFAAFERISLRFGWIQARSNSPNPSAQSRRIACSKTVANQTCFSNISVRNSKLRRAAAKIVPGPAVQQPQLLLKDTGLKWHWRASITSRQPFVLEHAPFSISKKEGVC